MDKINTKEKLAKEIIKAVQEFTKETGVSVVRIDFELFDSSDFKKSAIDYIYNSIEFDMK